MTDLENALECGDLEFGARVAPLTFRCVRCGSETEATPKGPATGSALVALLPADQVHTVCDSCWFDMFPETKEGRAR